MKNLKNKLDEIIDTEMKQTSKVWDLAFIEQIQKKYSLAFPNDYVYYLQYYGNDYIKDNYFFKPDTCLEKVLNQNSFELDSIFGLYNDVNNLEEKIIFYKNIIPLSLFPIADLPGGNLVCMNKKEQKVYFWIHDKVKDTYLVAQNFSDFISHIQFGDAGTVNLEKVKLNLKEDLVKMLEKNIEKYR